MLLTVTFMALMFHTLHQALRDMRAKEAAELADDLESAHALRTPGGGLSTPYATPTLRHIEACLPTLDEGEGAPFLPLPESPPRTWEITPQRLDVARVWDASASACGARSPGSEPPSPRDRRVSSEQMR